MDQYSKLSLKETHAQQRDTSRLIQNLNVYCLNIVTNQSITVNHFIEVVNNKQFNLLNFFIDYKQTFDQFYKIQPSRNFTLLVFYNCVRLNVCGFVWTWITFVLVCERLVWTVCVRIYSVNNEVYAAAAFDRVTTAFCDYFYTKLAIILWTQSGFEICTFVSVYKYLKDFNVYISVYVKRCPSRTAIMT